MEDLLGIAESLYADYGVLGLYRYNGGWTQVSGADADRFASYGEKLVVNFLGFGLYEYGESNWTPLAGNDGVSDMAGVDLP